MTKRQFREGDGPSNRQLRVGELIRRALADLLMRGEVHDETVASASITVGEVRASPDLRHATVFVMPLGGVNAAEVLAALRRNKGELRREVARAVKLKYAPDLKFELDESYDRMDETRRLLDEARVRRDIARDGDPDHGADGD